MKFDHFRVQFKISQISISCYDFVRHDYSFHSGRLVVPTLGYRTDYPFASYMREESWLLQGLFYNRRRLVESSNDSGIVDLSRLYVGFVPWFILLDYSVT